MPQLSANYGLEHLETVVPDNTDSRTGDRPTLDEENVEQFQRIEDKFLVSRKHFSDLMSLLETMLQPCYFEPGTQFNMIESIYFDSANLKIFTDHFTNQTSRFKLRLRKYGPNGVWPDEDKLVHLEMKLKAQGMTDKYRIKVGPNETAALSVGEPLPMAFILTKKKEKVVDRIWQINGVVSQHKLRPQARVTYRRRAFEKDGLRVTIDDQIKAEILNPVAAEARKEITASDYFDLAKKMRATYQSDDYLVIEVKHSGVMPEWITGFLGGINSAPASFSKYAYTISQHLVEL